MIRAAFPLRRRQALVRHRAPAASRTLRNQLEEVWKDLEDAAVGGVSEDERRTILRVLKELEESLTQAAAELRV